MLVFHQIAKFLGKGALFIPGHPSLAQCLALCSGVLKDFLD